MRDNRTRLCRYVRGRSVLDLFAYAGAFSVRAALAGASAVTCLDSSETACRLATENAGRNGVGGVVTTIRADAAAFLEDCAATGRTFDVVSLDPPALVRRKKDLEAGLRLYERLNRLAMEKQLAASGQVQNFAADIRRRDGAIVPTWRSVRLIDGEEPHYEGFVQDASDRSAMASQM